MILISKFSNAVIGIIYKDLEHSASNLDLTNKENFKNMQKLKDPNEQDKDFGNYIEIENL